VNIIKAELTKPALLLFILPHENIQVTLLIKDAHIEQPQIDLRLIMLDCRANPQIVTIKTLRHH
jgi:hypothetical protein